MWLVHDVSLTVLRVFTGMASDLADAIVRLAVDQRDHPAQRFQLEGAIKLNKHDGNVLFMGGTNDYPVNLDMRLTAYEGGIAGQQRGRVPDLWVKPFVPNNWTKCGSTFPLTPENIPRVAKHIVAMLAYAMMDLSLTDSTPLTRFCVVFGHHTNLPYVINVVFNRMHTTSVSQLRNQPEVATRALAGTLTDLVEFVRMVETIDEN